MVILLFASQKMCLCSCKALIVTLVILVLVGVLAGIIGVAVKREIDRTYVETVNSLKEAIPDYVQTTFKLAPALPPLPHWKRSVEDYMMYLVFPEEKEE